MIKKPYGTDDAVFTTEQASALSALAQLISIPGCLDKAKYKAPFGESVRRALDYCLELSKNLGFCPVDADGYAGFCDLDDSKKDSVHVLSHVDVVPIGNDWKHGQGEIADGRIYGRGAMDDKGPLLACLFALARIKNAGTPLKRNVRLIWGCNEENGSKCIEHYSKKYGRPRYGFSPDADFPFVSCEKTILHLQASLPLPKALLSWNAGTRPNVVPDSSTAVLDVNAVGTVTCKNIEAYDVREDETVCSYSQEDRMTMWSKGRAAHAMHPSEGDSAIYKTAHILHTYCGSLLDPTFDRFCKTLCSPDALERLGLACSDERSGEQTVNIGRIETDDGKLLITFDFRCPVCADLEKIKKTLSKFFGSKVKTLYHAPYLAADSNGLLVKTLSKVYTRHFDGPVIPIVSGGGTYARAMDDGVAFGAQIEGVDNCIHDADEFIDIPHFFSLIDIYEDAMIALANA